MAAPVSPERRLWQRRWIGRALALLAFVLLMLLSLVAYPSSWAAGEQSSFTAEADTFIDGNEPNKNFGDATELAVKDNPPAASFVRFALNGAPQGSSMHATLRLYVTDGSAGAAVNLYVFRTSSDWNEHELSWNTQPALGDQVGASEALPLSEGQWVEIDLGALAGEELQSFAITSNSPDRVSFAAHTESEAPELVIAPQQPTAAPATPTGEPTETTPTQPTDTTSTPTATVNPTDGSTTATPTPSSEPTAPTVEPTEDVE